LSVPFSAAVTVAGDPVSLQAYRLRVSELLDEGQVDDYRELHTMDRLDWRFRLKGGVPFPAFVESSIEFPDLLVRIEWERPAEGQKGVAIIQNGNVNQQMAEAGALADKDMACYDLQVAAGGQLRLALVVRGWRNDELIGYVLSADQHAWFHISRDGEALTLSASDGMEDEWAERWRVEGGHAQYRELGESVPIEAGMRKELEQLATSLCDEWIWFAASPAEETIVERQRYEQYGLATHEANVRSVKLRTVMQALPEGGYVFAATRPDVIEARELLLRCWIAAH
jgi:hypothetical protein